MCSRLSSYSVELSDVGYVVFLARLRVPFRVKETSRPAQAGPFPSSPVKRVPYPRTLFVFSLRSRRKSHHDLDVHVCILFSLRVSYGTDFLSSSSSSHPRGYSRLANPFHSSSRYSETNKPLIHSLSTNLHPRPSIHSPNHTA